MLTRDAVIVQSSHQKGAADSFLANNRKATAMVARATLTTLPSHTFQATLSSGGNGTVMVGTRSSKQERAKKKEEHTNRKREPRKKKRFLASLD